MRPKTKFFLALLLSAAFSSCSSSGKKSSDAPAEPQQPQEEATVQPSPSSNGSPGSSQPKFDRAKIEQRYRNTATAMLKATPETPDADVQNIINNHMLSVECAVHVFGLEWSERKRAILREVLSTSEKQNSYVRTMRRSKSKVITLKPISELDRICL